MQLHDMSTIKNTRNILQSSRSSTRLVITTTDLHNIHTAIIPLLLFFGQIFSAMKNKM